MDEDSKVKPTMINYIIEQTRIVLIEFTILCTGIRPCLQNISEPPPLETKIILYLNSRSENKNYSTEIPKKIAYPQLHMLGAHL